jgi:CHASE2 domain-containing sensor protein
MRMPRWREAFRALPSRRRRFIQIWLLGAAASVCVTSASAFGLLEGSQAKALDFLLRLRVDGPIKQDADTTSLSRWARPRA